MEGSVVVVLTLVISFKNTLEGRYLHLSRNFPLGYIPRKYSAAFEHMYMHVCISICIPICIPIVGMHTGKLQ